VSVDTYLKGKDTGAYARLLHDDIELLLAPSLTRWAEEVRLDVSPSLFRRRFAVTVEHRHTAACRH
jgi:hypothetical protein